MTKWLSTSGLICFLAIMFSHGAFANGLALGDPSYGGTGCPQGSASTTLSPDRQVLSIIFDRFITEAGGSAGVASDRKNCDLAVPVHVPPGFTVAIFATDYRGFVELPAGASAQFTADYYFAGQPGASHSKNFNGVLSQDYNFHAPIESQIWSACGEEVILRSRSSMKVTTNAQRDHALGTIDSADFTTGIIFQLEMRPCDSTHQPPPVAGEFRYNSQRDLSHQFGFADGDGWAVRAGEGVGYLSFGPYATNWGSGGMRATYRLMVDNNSADNNAIILLDVYDATAAEVIAIKSVTRRQFINPFAYQEFSLDFDLSGREGHAMEARVYTVGYSYIRVGNLTVRSKNAPQPPPTGMRIRYEAERDMHHLIGFADGDGWAVLGGTGGGYMVYGPYARVWGGGPRRAIFRTMIDSPANETFYVMNIDVFDASTNEVIASRDVFIFDFPTSREYQDIVLDFDLAGRDGHLMEARVFAYGAPYIKVDSITIEER